MVTPSIEQKLGEQNPDLKEVTNFDAANSQNDLQSNWYIKEVTNFDAANSQNDLQSNYAFGDINELNELDKQEETPEAKYAELEQKIRHHEEENKDLYKRIDQFNERITNIIGFVQGAKKECETRYNHLKKENQTLQEKVKDLELKVQDYELDKEEPKIQLHFSPYNTEIKLKREISLEKDKQEETSEDVLKQIEELLPWHIREFGEESFCVKYAMKEKNSNPKRILKALKQIMEDHSDYSLQKTEGLKRVREMVEEVKIRKEFK